MKDKLFYTLDLIFCIMTGAIPAMGFLVNSYWGIFALFYAALFHIIRWFYYFDGAVLFVNHATGEQNG